MRPNIPAPAGASGGKYPDPVKPGSWAAMMIDHARRHGGQCVVIERNNGAQRQQWRAWIAYFAWLDDCDGGHKAAVFAKLDKITPPTAWPVEFDASAPASPPPERSPEPVTRDRRRALANGMRGIMGHVKPSGRPAPTPDARFAPTPEAGAEIADHWQDRLEKLRDEYAANPIILSGAAKPAAESAVEPGELAEAELAALDRDPLRG